MQRRHMAFAPPALKIEIEKFEILWPFTRRGQSMNAKVDIYSKLLVWVFLGILSLPSLLFLLPVETTSRFIDEKRRLSPLPAISLIPNQIQEFPRGFEHYFDDHFQLRDYLILGNNYLKHKLWKRSSNQKVVMGSGGWLFWGGDHELEDYLTLKPFTLEELQARQRVLESKRDWLARRGIRYMFVIPPNKESIYPEFMPKNYQAMHGRSRLDQFVAYMEQHSDVDIIDLRQVLRAAKADYQVYFRLDSHWNEMGSLIASREIFKRLTSYMDSNLYHLSSKGLADYRIHSAKRQRIGDLAQLMGYPIEDRDDCYLIEPKFERISRKERLPDFLGFDWNPMPAPFVLTGVTGGLRGVIFHDSFAIYLAPFFPEQFQRSLFLWHHNPTGELFKKVVEAENPDVVIEEVLERFLYHLETDTEYHPLG